MIRFIEIMKILISRRISARNKFKIIVIR